MAECVLALLANLEHDHQYDAIRTYLKTHNQDQLDQVKTSLSHLLTIVNQVMDEPENRAQYWVDRRRSQSGQDG